METLNYEGNSLGGMCKVRIIDVDLVDDMPDAINGIISAAVGDEADWETIPFQQQVVDMQQQELKKGGTVYPLVMNANVRRQTGIKTQSLYALSKKRLLIDFTDLNGTRRLAGTKDEPARMELVRMTTPRQAKELNEYQITFVGTWTAPVPAYNPA